MEYQAAQPFSARIVLDRAIERAPRLAVLVLLLFAWLLTLAWPPPSSSSRPLVQGQSSLISGYPLRVDMPDPRSISLDELMVMVERHAVLADLGFTFPEEVIEEAVSPPSRPLRSSSDFASAFADLNDPVAARARDERAAAAIMSAEGLEPGQFLSLDYDLATLDTTRGDTIEPGSGNVARFNSEDGSLTVTKPLLVDGQARGIATIRIEEGAQILMATSSVANALGARVEDLPRRVAGAIAAGTGFIPFHELRGAGISVEYDAVNDRVALSMPAGA